MRAAGIDSFGREVRVLDLAVPGPPRADEVLTALAACYHTDDLMVSPDRGALKRQMAEEAIP